VIGNVATLLSRQPGTPDSTRRDLASIVENCRRCAHIVENLLRFGRPLRLRPEPMDLAAFCRQGVDEAAIRRQLRAYGVEAGPTEPRNGAEGEGPSIYVTDPEGTVVELKGPPGAAPGQH